jgi:CDP-glucose 4,6-dehydratase
MAIAITALAGGQDYLVLMQRMVMFCDVFRGKSVFVTGHTGFKGSWLSLWLHHLGAKVHGYSLAPPTTPNHFTQSGITDVLQEHLIADVRDTGRLRQAIEAAEPDLIFHLAAQTVVKTGYTDPFETFSTNVMGTVSLLEAIRTIGRPCSAILITSDKCYENREQVWGYRECDPMGERDPYGGSKGAAELAIRSYRESYFPPTKSDIHGIRIASARAGNVIGGGDWTDHALVVDMVKALSENRPISIRSPNAFRPWQHVLQALHGYLTLAVRLLGESGFKYCSGWNIGPLPGNEIPVHQVVSRFLKEWGSGRWEDRSEHHSHREAEILRLSIDKALWELNWKPVWDIDKTIQATAAWYKQWMSNPHSTRDCSLRQIVAFEHDASLLCQC